MGDVFDRIVERAGAARGPERAAALTMRRAPALEGEPAVVGEEARPGTAEDPAPGPPGPATSGGGGPAVVRHEVRAPAGALGAQPAPAPVVDVVESPALLADLRSPDAARPHGDTAAHGVRPDALGPAGTAPESASVEASPPVARAPQHAGSPATRAALRARPRSSLSGPAARAPATRTMPADELLRDHLVPALEEHGAWSAPDDVRLSASGLDAIDVPVGGDVHVHLGHVEVVQQTPARPAPEQPRAEGGGAGDTERVDHADYLARQRRRWS